MKIIPLAFVLLKEDLDFDVDNNNAELERNLKAKHCEYIRIRDMEKMCKLGQKYVIKKVSC